MRNAQDIRTVRDIKSFRSCAHATRPPLTHLEPITVSRGGFTWRKRPPWAWGRPESARGRVTRSVALVSSLTLENARLVNELKEAKRLKSDFLATMSHELRTPLNTIMGYNDLVIDGEFGALTVEQAEPLRAVGKSARQLLELIEATLA